MAGGRRGGLIQRGRAGVGLSALLAMVASLLVLPAGAALGGGCDTSSQAFAGGNGTAEQPYEVATAEQLGAIDGALLLCDFVQVADIALGGQPVGSVVIAPTEDSPFAGSYDGGGHRIDGLAIAAASMGEVHPSADVGLFGYVKGAELRNLTVAGTVSVASVYRQAAGGVVGRVLGGSGDATTLHDVRSETDVAASGDAGGLIGHVGEGATVELTDVSAIGRVAATDGSAGGLVGVMVAASVTVAGARVDGYVISGREGSDGVADVVNGNAGGLVGLATGSARTLEVADALIGAEVTATARDAAFAGGVVGQLVSETAIIRDTEVSGGVRALAGTARSGGLVGGSTDATVRVRDVRVSGIVAALTPADLIGEGTDVSQVAAGGLIGQTLRGQGEQVPDVDVERAEVTGVVAAIGPGVSVAGGVAGALDGGSAEVRRVEVSGIDSPLVDRGVLAGGSASWAGGVVGRSQGADLRVSASKVSTDVRAVPITDGLDADVVTAAAGGVVGGAGGAGGSTTVEVADTYVTGGVSTGGELEVLSASSADGGEADLGGATDGAPAVMELSVAGGVVGLVEREQVHLDNVYTRGPVSAVQPGSDDGLGGAGGLVGAVDPAMGVLVEPEQSAVEVSASFFDQEGTGQEQLVALDAGDRVSTTEPAGGREPAQLKRRATFVEAGWSVVAGWASFASPERVWGSCGDVEQGYPFLLWEYDADPCPATGRPPAAPQPSAEPVDDPVTQRLPVLATGAVLALVDGEVVEATVTDTGGGLHVSVDGVELVLDLTRRLDTVGAGRWLRVPADAGVTVTGSGLRAGSHLRVWLFSEPQQLASLRADGAGAVQGQVERLPEGLAACAHTMQLVGTDPQGRQVAVSVPIEVQRVPGPFTDVAAGGVHGFAVGCLHDRGVVRGTGDGRYSPATALTRGQVASLLAGALELDTGGEPAFEDARDSVHAGAIAAVAQEGLVVGFSDGSFGARRPITRAQLASMVAAAAALDGVEDGPFDDVDRASVHARAIDAAADAGMVSGTTPRTFAPHEPLRRDQAASVIHRLGRHLAATATGSD